MSIDTSVGTRYADTCTTCSDSSSTTSSSGNGPTSLDSPLTPLAQTLNVPCGVQMQMGYAYGGFYQPSNARTPNNNSNQQQRPTCDRIGALRDTTGSRVRTRAQTRAQMRAMSQAQVQTPQPTTTDSLGYFGQQQSKSWTDDHHMEDELSSSSSSSTSSCLQTPQAPWTPVQDTILLSVYQSYTEDPTVAPFAVYAPPSGAVQRVAKTAIRRARQENCDFPHSLHSCRQRLRVLVRRPPFATNSRQLGASSSAIATTSIATTNHPDNIPMTPGSSPEPSFGGLPLLSPFVPKSTTTATTTTIDNRSPHSYFPNVVPILQPAPVPRHGTTGPTSPRRRGNKRGVKK